MTRRTKIWAGLLLLALASVVLARGVELVYKSIDAATVSLHRTAVTADDTLDVETASSNAFKVRGDPTVEIAPTFSGAGATVTIEVYRYAGTTTAGTFMGVAWIGTATGATERVNGARYITESPISVDTGGATYIDIRLRDVSAGNVSLNAWTVGATTDAQ